MQIGHSGPKGATKEPWKWDPEILDEPLDEQDRWPILAPSALPYDSYSPVPKAMDRDDMDLVRQQHVDAVKRADAAGFDMLELHAAHGYLMSSFITPVQNKRKDEYGGSLENRLRYPLEVFAAMREVWPKKKPMSVRISAHDWMDGDSVTPDEAVQIARAFSDAGADIIDVSSGQTSHESEPIFGRMFQTPLSDKIRNEAHVATMAVGNIYEVDHVNSILAAGRADLCCLARPHLADPRWTLRAAAQYEYRGEAVVEPNQYFHGYRQLELNLKRAAEMAINA
jgi:anthraniloyl-CoA monooxygenase